MLLTILSLATSALCIAMAGATWRFQGRILFGKTRHLRTLRQGPLAVPQRVSPLWLEVAENICIEGWVAQAENAEQPRVLIYFGGRNEHVGWVSDMASYLGPWTIYAFNYRGMGKSGGRASESTAKSDALKIVDEVRRLEGGKLGHLAIVGRSLGTAVAIALAARSEVRFLVLLSPFESLAQLVRKHPLLNAVRWALQSMFDSRLDAARVRAKTAVLLAEQDARVPHQSSYALAQRFHCQGAVRIVPGTNHQTLPRHPVTQAAIANFLNRA